jgi:murein peptide amidase A
MRNYSDIVERVNALDRPYINHRVLGEVEGHQILCVTLSTNSQLPTILINAGTHGDEPASVESVLAFLDQNDTSWLKVLRFEVIPCLNPYGYVHNTRHNRQDVDINWAYFRNDVQEIEIFQRFVDRRRFEAVIDLHEDWESSGYYMYEQRRGTPIIGHELVKRVSTVCPLNTNPCIEGVEAVNSVIEPDSESVTAERGAGIPIVLFQQHTNHLITSETPTALSMKTRVCAHLIAVQAMIEAHLSA